MTIKTKIISVGMPKQWLRKNKFSKYITRPSLQAAVRFWHKTMSANHFKPGAANRYKYRPRKQVTMNRKRYAARRLGREDMKYPLIWSGDTMRHVARGIRIRGTNVKVKGILDVPRYVYMWANASDRPYLAGEILATTHDERNSMARVIDQQMTRRMRSDRTKETVTV